MADSLIDQLREKLGFETPKSRAEKDATLLKKAQETGAAVTPGLAVKQENAELSKQNMDSGRIQGAGKVVSPGAGKKTGGLVKAKPRGVGIARKGHGRAHHG